MRVDLVANPFATGQWSNMPAAEDFFNSTVGTHSVVNLAGYTHVQLVGFKGATAGNAGSKVYLKMYTSGSTTAVGSFAAIGTSSVEVAVDTANATLDSGVIPLAQAARVDGLLIALTGDGGDGVIDPRFGTISAVFT